MLFVALRSCTLGVFFACSAAQSAVTQPDIITLAADGAWTWFNDPRAVFHNGTLYFGHCRSDGKSALSAYAPTRGSTLLWTSTWTERDDHDNPGLLPMSDGRLLAVYAHHGTTSSFNYRISLTTNPVSPADWSAESSFNNGAPATYSNPYQLSAERGTIYDFLRALNFNPTVTTSTNEGKNWSMPRTLIRTGTNSTIRPYVKYCSDYISRIDFLYTDGHPNRLTNSLYHMYYGDGALHHTDGSFLKSFADLPLLHDASERGSIVYRYSDAPSIDPNDHIPAGRAFCWEIVRPTANHPVCVFSVRRSRVTGTHWYDDRIYYYYASWTGSRWQKRFIAHAGRPLYDGENDYAGGICLDPENPNVVYISSNAAKPFSLTNTIQIPLSDSGHYEIFRGVTTNAGLGFNWTTVTTNSAMDNLRPYVPRNHAKSPALIWFCGTYSSYSRFNSSVVGIFANPSSESH